MKPEEKAAIKDGAATAAIASAAALVIGSPVCWAAVLYGTYRVARSAYRRTKYRDTLHSRDQDTDLFI
jgi:hypothetical protein